MNRPQKVAAGIAAVTLLAVGLTLGAWWGTQSATDDDAQSTAMTGDRQILYWYDPMVPDQHFDKPGKSPFMDMQLVPKYADGGEDAGVSIAPGVRQNLGIRTVEAELGSLSGSITVPGTIGWDLRQEHVVSARVDTIVEHVFVRAPYERVAAGQALARVLAPTWSTALAEAQAVRSAESDVARSLLPAARNRVRMLGLPADSRVEEGRIVLTAPVSGVVTEIVARSGATAAAGTLLFDGAEYPLVPSEAVIGGGTQARVIILTPEGRIQPVPVRLGRSAGGMTEILAGLQGGEQVVASGQFLIDSEASLSGALDRLETDAMEMEEDTAP